MIHNSRNIVILGAGFGGLRAARELSRQLKRHDLASAYRVILVDRNPYHTYTPLLYEVATTSKETANYCELKSLVTYRLTDVLAGYDIDIVNDEVLHIDLREGKVHLARQKLPFEYLVLALGSETNYFDIPELKERAFTLKSFMDAIALRERLVESIQDKKMTRVIVGGGGATGVELASEIMEWVCEIGKTTCPIAVFLIEGSPRVLNGFAPNIVEKVEHRLAALGVKTIANETIKAVEERRVTLASGITLPYDILVWTGGVRAASLTQKLPLKRGARGRVEIVNTLECIPENPDLKMYGKVYAIGDIACFYNPESGKPIPQVAHVAIIQGSIVAKNITEEIKREMGFSKQATLRTYQPMDYPYIISVGGKHAVAKIGPLAISGIFGWILKGLVELNYLVSLMPPWRAFKIWLKGLKVFIQNDRLG